jgi:hypothetical protein
MKTSIDALQTSTTALKAKSALQKFMTHGEKNIANSEE